MLSVRRATPEDVNQVAGVHVRSWQSGYQGLLPAEYLDALRAEDRSERYDFGAAPARDQPVTVVAVEQDTIYGFATTGACRDADAAGAGQVFAVYVDPDHWRQGVGRLLIAQARDQLGRDGFREAVLWVVVGNERAEEFYRADGWVPDGCRQQEEVWGLTVDQVRYRRPLP